MPVEACSLHLMWSSSMASSDLSELGRWRPAVIALALTSAACAVLFQRPLASTVALARETEDVSLLPAAERAPLLSLGFDAALADILWAKLLIDYGTHLAEKRSFSSIRYAIDMVLALEPGSDRVFRYVDTLVLFQAKKASEDDARYVRRVLEVGIDAQPTNAKRWLAYGTYLAYLAPSFLSDETEIRAWTLRAGEAFAHALELGAGVDDTRAAVSLFERGGADRAQLDYLERAYALASDDDKPALEVRLEKLAARTTLDLIRKHDGGLEDERLAALPGLSPLAYRLLRKAPRPACDAPRQWSTPGCLE